MKRFNLILSVFFLMSLGQISSLSAISEEDWKHPALRLGASSAEIRNALGAPVEFMSQPGVSEIYDFKGNKKINMGIIEYENGKVIGIGKIYRPEVTFAQIKSMLVKKLKPETENDRYLIFVDNKNGNKRYMILEAPADPKNWGPGLIKTNETGYQKWLLKIKEAAHQKELKQESENQLQAVAKKLDMPYGRKNRRVATRLKEAWKGKKLVETLGPIEQQLMNAEKRVLEFNDFTNAVTYEITKDGAKGNPRKGEVSMEEWISSEEDAKAGPSANQYILELVMPGWTSQYCFRDVIMPEMKSFKGANGNDFTVE